MSKKLHYPKCMFPYKGLRSSIDMGELAQLEQDVALVRRIEHRSISIIEDMGDGLMVISPKIMLEMLADAVDMSMNIYSVDCPVEYYHYIQPSQPACAKWDGKNVDIESCNGHVDYMEDCFSIIYPMSKLYNKPGSYKRTYPDASSYKKDYELINGVKDVVDASFSRNTVYPRNYKLLVSHHPTNANYWHVTLDIYAPSMATRPIKKKPQDGKPKWMFEGESSILLQVWMNYLRQGFSVEKTDILPLPSKYCYDKDCCIVSRLANKYKRNWLARNIKV